MTIIERGVVVHGNIQAENLTIAGEVHGDVMVRNRLELLPGAKLIGDARCALFCVHPGAYFERTRAAAEAAPSQQTKEEEPVYFGGFAGSFGPREPERARS